MTTRTFYVLATTTGTARLLGTTAPPAASVPFGDDTTEAGYHLWAAGSDGNTHQTSQTLPAPNGNGLEYAGNLAGYRIGPQVEFALKLKASSSRTGTLWWRLYVRDGASYDLFAHGFVTCDLTSSYQVLSVDASGATSPYFGAATRLYLDFTHETASGTAVDVTVDLGATSWVSAQIEQLEATGAAVAHATLTGAATVSNTAGTKAMPLVRTQIALTGTVWEGSDWVDIGPFVETIDTTLGRQHELMRPEAGKADLTVYNQDGRFNSWATNSPYYNQLPPTDSNPTTGIGTWTVTT